MPIQWSTCACLRAGLIALALLGAGGASAADAPQYGAWGFDLTAMDRSVKPGNDFNRYASGAWLARTQIPPDKAIASLRYVMSDQIEARLHTLMESAAAGAPPQPVSLSDKVGAFYKAFMDEARVEGLGAPAIAPQLRTVRAARDRDQLAALMGREQFDFEGSIFGLNTDVDLKNVDRYAVYVGQAGLGLPDRDYYPAARILRPEGRLSGLCRQAAHPRRMAQRAGARRGDRHVRDPHRSGQLDEDATARSAGDVQSPDHRPASRPGAGFRVAALPFPPRALAIGRA